MCTPTEGDYRIDGVEVDLDRGKKVPRPRMIEKQILEDRRKDL